jgi:acyl-CoA synthetase (AMP-forming)/AMP-acid ligase II
MEKPTFEIPKFDVPHFDYYWQYIDYWSGIDPDFPSLTQGDRIVRAGRFKQLVDRLAQAFLSFGIEKGDRIVSILPMGIDFVVTLVAAGAVGAILVPMDVKFRTRDLERFLSHAKPSLILSITGVKDFNTVEKLKGLSGQFGDIPKVLVGSAEFGRSFEDLLAEKFGREDELETRKRSLNTADGSLIIFTGGTTGVPKAALLNNLNTTFMSYIEYGFFRKALSQVGIEGRIRSLAALPPSHVGGTVELVGMPLVGGFEVILMEDWSPYKVLEVTANQKIPWMGGVPTMYAILLSLPDLDTFDLSCVKLAALGGERVSLELATGIKEKISPVLVSGYGSTEAGSAVSYTEPGDDLAWIDEGYVGKPFPTVTVRIVDNHGNEVPRTEVGEVIIGGPLVIPHYYNMPEEDEAGFTPDGWCKTGDLGYLTEDGGIYIKGRIKQIIRVGSYTVLPTEVEDVAAQYPNVGLSAAIGIPDKIYGEVVWLYVAPVWGTAVDTDGLTAYLKENLAAFKVPKKIVIKDDIPITRIGKSDRTALRNEVIKTLSETG